MSPFIPGQIKREAMRRCEALIPGCDKLCKELKTVCLNVSGTKGRGVPVDVSQRSWSEHMGIAGTLSKT